MPEVSNQQYLLSQQYNNAANLNARIQLHERFSTNKYDWHRWVFDHLTIAPGSRILELGCGPARLWLNNLERIPQDWQITLSDFSAGMLEETRQSLRESNHPFTFKVVDAQAIPFADASFDVVIANHMLYHVPDRARAIAEIRRVLKPGGRFYAATNGQAHMQELADLIRIVNPAYNYDREVRGTFSLESGTQELAQQFSQVQLHIYESSLVVTEVEPLMDYIHSGWAKSFMTEELLQALRSHIEQEIAERGAFHITKSTGLFEAY